MGQIQNQLNQMLATALGAGIAYQHSPYAKKRQAYQVADFKLQGLEEIERDYINDLAETIGANFDEGGLEKYAWDDPELNKEITNWYNAATRFDEAYDKALNEKEEAIMRYGSKKERQELMEKQKQRSLELEIAPQDEQTQAQKVMARLKRSLEPIKESKPATKTDEGKPDMLDSWQGFYESLGRAYDGKKTVNDAVQERFSILANPGTAMQGPGANREVFPSRTEESATAIKKTPTVVAKQAGSNYQKPETVVQNPGYKAQKPMETVIKKGQLPTPVPETPDTYEETATAILDKPGSRLYKG